MQETRHGRHVPAGQWRATSGGCTGGFIGEGLVAAVGDRAGLSGHAECMVQGEGPRQHGREPRRVTDCRKPPWYVTRTPGGVRGGRREASPYSIGRGRTRGNKLLPASSFPLPVVDGGPSHALTAGRYFPSASSPAAWRVPAS